VRRVHRLANNTPAWAAEKTAHVAEMGEREHARLPRLVEDLVATLDDDRAEAVHAAHVVHAVHSGRVPDRAIAPRPRRGNRPVCVSQPSWASPAILATRCGR